MEWIAVAVTFSVLILVHEFGHFWMARRVGVKIEKFSFGLGAKLFSFKRNDIEYRISAVPFGGYVKMAGDEPDETRRQEPWEFLSQTVGNRFKIVFAGPLLNYIFGFILFSAVFYMGYPSLTTKIGGLIDGYPAQKSGIKVGDKIVAIDARSVRNWDEVAEIIHKKTGVFLTLALDRGGSEILVNLKPNIEEKKDLLGRTTKVGLIGIKPSEEVQYIRCGIFKSFELGFKRLMKVTLLTYQSLWMLITGELPFKESVAGPIGMISLIASTARVGVIPLLQLTAYISILLSIFNVFPIPVLDGGHMIFLILEKIRGRPLNAKIQGIATQVGMVFLIALMLLVSYNDMMLRIFKK